MAQAPPAQLASRGPAHPPLPIAYSQQSLWHLFHPSQLHLPMAEPRTGKYSNLTPSASLSLITTIIFLFSFSLEHTFSFWRTCATCPIAQVPEKKSLCCQSSSLWVTGPNSALIRLCKCQEALGAPAVWLDVGDVDIACTQPSEQNLDHWRY